MYLVVAALELFALVAAALVSSSDHHHGLAVAIILDHLLQARLQLAKLFVFLAPLGAIIATAAEILNTAVGLGSLSPDRT